MPTDRAVRLTHRQLALKRATREAVRAAGGQELVAGEVGRSQGRISDYGSRHTADFVPLDVAEVIDALGAGSPGWPHLAGALARAQGLALDPASEDLAAVGCDDLGERLARVTKEFSDLAGCLSAQGLAAPLADLTPAAREQIAGELAQLEAEVGGFRGALDDARLRAKDPITLVRQPRADSS